MPASEIAYTVRGLVEQVRRDLDDLPGDVGDLDAWIYDDSDLLWKNAELIRYLNEARYEHARRRPIQDASSAFTSIAVSADTATYSYDDCILYIDHARMAGQDHVPSLTKKTLSWLDWWDKDWRSLKSDRQDYYTEDEEERKLTLVPIPEADGTLELVVGRLPTDYHEWPTAEWQADTTYSVGDLVFPTEGARNGHYYKVTVAGVSGSAEPTWPTDGSTVVDGGVTWEDQGVIGATTITEPKAPDQRHLHHWMKHLAYLKRDSQITNARETYNLKLSGYHEGQFTLHVGPQLSDYLKKQRREERNLRRRVRAHQF